METAFNSTVTENWDISNAETIARYFGYVCTKRFQKELNKFILKQINGATVLQYIEIIAGRHFKDIKPPLKRMK